MVSKNKVYCGPLIDIEAITAPRPKTKDAPAPIDPVRIQLECIRARLELLEKDSHSDTPSDDGKKKDPEQTYLSNDEYVGSISTEESKSEQTEEVKL